MDNLGSEGVGTVAALHYAKIDRGFWNSAVQRQVITDLPVARPGRTGRMYGVDDLVSMEVFAALLAIGVIVNVAGHIADDLRAMLRAHGRLKTLYLVLTPDEEGVTRPKIVRDQPKDCTTLWVLNITVARANARRAIAEHLAE